MSVRVEGGNTRLSAYSILRRIGKGSYGEVYLVATGDAKKQYVMKNIKLTSSSVKERLGAEQEAALLSHLHHPNIVSYKESFQDDSGVLHIVMGYCEGGDLHSRLKAYGDSFLPETKVVEWFVQIALGLQYLHDRNILHRDLKTQNIFLSKNDIIKVGDLGIARVLDGSCDLAHTVIGTPYYMSPELFANQPYNHKSDIWALGCCVHEIASLKHAFSARNINALMFKVIQGKAPPIPPHYSRELIQLVQQMLAQKAEARPDVHQILRKAFIRKHIQMFLDRAAERKRNKGKPPIQPVATPKRKHEGGDERELLVQANVDTKKQIGKESISQSPPPACAQQAVEKVSRPLPPDPSSSDQVVVSSARQRRRKSKLQEGHGKIIPKSSEPPTNDCVDHSHSINSAFTKQAEGQEQQGTDGQLDQCTECSHNKWNGQIDHEVADFYTLLDSTLHMSPEVDVPPAPPNEQHSSPLPSGRLAERIRALRMECELALGTEVMHEIMELLRKADPEEESQEGLKLVLGPDRYENYAAKLQQLKLCQDSLSVLS